MICVGLRTTYPSKMSMRIRTQDTGTRLRVHVARSPSARAALLITFVTKAAPAIYLQINLLYLGSWKWVQSFTACFERKMCSYRLRSDRNLRIIRFCVGTYVICKTSQVCSTEKRGGFEIFFRMITNNVCLYIYGNISEAASTFRTWLYYTCYIFQLELMFCRSRTPSGQWTLSWGCVFLLFCFFRNGGHDQSWYHEFSRQMGCRVSFAVAHNDNTRVKIVHIMMKYV